MKTALAETWPSKIEKGETRRVAAEALTLHALTNGREHPRT